METKQNIFPLYLGSKIHQTSTNKNMFFEGIANGMLLVENHWIDISDCQLILHSISEMSEEKQQEYRRTGYNNAWDSYGNEAWFPSLDSFNWLRKNKFALDDSWFEGDNPIAVKEGL